MHRSGFVAVVGPANAGKSTLVNALVGRKVAGVSPRPHTTRRRILGVRTEADCQIVFMDTPGLGHAEGRLGEYMGKTAVSASREADLVLWVTDVSVTGAPGDERILGGVRAPKFAVLNKVDRVAKASLLPLIERLSAGGRFEEIVPVCAKTGDGVGRLLAAVRARLPEGPVWYDAASVPGTGDESLDRGLIQELVQEQLFSRMRQEVPYGCGVAVRTAAREGGLVRIEADILVERDSHKPIVIGKGGRQLKEIGAAARRELEAATGAKVFLGLWVKVEEGWRDRPAVLADLGFVPEA